MLSSRVVRKPRNVVVVLLDSLNRHMLGAYGGTEFDTPNLDAFAQRAVRFDRHYVGGIPCMPARHDILVGNLDFPWRPWGSIEVWERPITVALREAGVTTMLVADHPHLFEIGGENYHCEFTAWQYERGSETDHWRTRPDPSWVGAPNHNLTDWMRELLQIRADFVHPYDRSRGWFRDESDFPGPRTMTSAARWLEENAGHHERFFLFVDEFDPHEPFDTPDRWASRYDAEWDVTVDGPRLIWPPYMIGAVEKGAISDREAHNIRANYGAKLAMIDNWFGEILAVLDRQSLWDDTAVIVCTDHGLFLGERDIWGKPPTPFFEPFGHTPLLIAWPGVPPGTQNALTTNVDLHATLRDVFDARSHAYRLHGESLAPLLADDVASIRDWALMGIWGCEVQITDGHRKYVRAPVDGNLPLSMWSNRWSSITPYNSEVARLPNPDRRASLDYMPGTDVPVIRQPYAAGDRMSMFAMARDPHATTHLYDLDVDPHETENRAGEKLERDYIDLLHDALDELEVPDDHYRRLGLA
jgi:arylsulfatase A-like enzyme